MLAIDGEPLKQPLTDDGLATCRKSASRRRVGVLPRREALRLRDAIEAENGLQHAEHYFRLMPEHTV